MPLPVCGQQQFAAYPVSACALFRAATVHCRRSQGSLVAAVFSLRMLTVQAEEFLHIVRVRQSILPRDDGAVKLQETDGAECRGGFFRFISLHTERRQREFKRLLPREEPFLLCGNVGGSTPAKHPFQHVDLFVCGNVCTENLQRCPVAAVIVE